MGSILERAWRAYLVQQSRGELERWRDCFEADGFRAERSWRYDLDRVWRMEFAPIFEPR